MKTQKTKPKKFVQYKFSINDVESVRIISIHDPVSTKNTVEDIIKKHKIDNIFITHLEINEQNKPESFLKKFKERYSAIKESDINNITKNDTNYFERLFKLTEIHNSSNFKYENFTELFKRYHTADELYNTLKNESVNIQKLDISSSNGKNILMISTDPDITTERIAKDAKEKLIEYNKDICIEVINTDTNNQDNKMKDKEKIKSPTQKILDKKKPKNKGVFFCCYSNNKSKKRTRH